MTDSDAPAEPTKRKRRRLSWAAAAGVIGLLVAGGIAVSGFDVRDLVHVTGSGPAPTTTGGPGAASPSPQSSAPSEVKHGGAPSVGPAVEPTAAPSATPTVAPTDGSTDGSPTGVESGL